MQLSASVKGQRDPGRGGRAALPTRWPPSSHCQGSWWLPGLCREGDRLLHQPCRGQRAWGSRAAGQEAGLQGPLQAAELWGILGGLLSGAPKAWAPEFLPSRPLSGSGGLFFLRVMMGQKTCLTVAPLSGHVDSLLFASAQVGVGAIPSPWPEAQPLRGAG